MKSLVKLRDDFLYEHLWNKSGEEPTNQGFMRIVGRLNHGDIGFCIRYIHFEHDENELMILTNSGACGWIFESSVCEIDNE